MKKLMVMLGVVALAAVTQAASVTWNSGTLYYAVDATGKTGTSGRSGSSGHTLTAYLYTFASLDAYNEAMATDVAKLYSDYVGKVTPVSSKSATPTGAANITQTNVPDGSDASPTTVYGMVLYVDTATAASYDNVDAFVKVGFGKGTFKDASGTSFADLGTQQANWTAVPEPTSGLLLLLGMAGLALRRRRA